MDLYYDYDANPIPVEEWLNLWKEERSIASDRYGGVLVSTVWLGIDNSFGNGPPLIYETLVMGGKFDGETFRARNRQEALDQHKRALQLLRDARGKRYAE